MELINTKIKVAKKYQHMIETIDNEGKESGIWAYSVKGYHFAGMGGECHTAHEYNQNDLIDMIRTLEPCQCKQCIEESSESEQEPLNTEIFMAKETIIVAEESSIQKKILEALEREGYTDIELAIVNESGWIFEAYTDGEVQVAVSRENNIITISDRYIEDKNWVQQGKINLDVDTNEWVDKKKKLVWADLEKLPNGLGEKILTEFISDYDFIKSYELTRDEAIKYIDAVGVEAHCCIYGIHGWMASLSVNNPQCLYWNVYDIDNFSEIFTKNECKPEKK